jgi:hypothetical protein
MPASCISPSGDAGYVLTIVDGSARFRPSTGGGGGSSYTFRDGGGISAEAGVLALQIPLCDGGGALVRGAGSAGSYECVPQGLGVNSVAGTAPIAVSGPGYAPVVAITPGSHGQIMSTNSSGVVGFESMGGDVACSSDISSCVVSKINGTSFSLPVSLANGGTGLTTSSGLTTGNELRATSATTIGYAATNLAGGSGYVTGNLPVANGGLGTAPTCVAGDLLMSSSSTAIGCVVSSGDVSYGSSGAATVTSLQNGEIVVGGSTATLTAASGATAPGLAQASTTSVTTTPMAFKPQASTNASGAGSIEEHLLVDGVGGSAASFTVDYGTLGTHLFVLSDQSGVYPVMCLGQGVAAPCTAGNALIIGNGSEAQFSSGPAAAVALVAGGYEQVFANNTEVDIPNIGSAQGNLAIGVTLLRTGSFGGGKGVLELINTSTAPTSACTGGTCISSDSSGLHFTDGSFHTSAIGYDSTNSAEALYLSPGGTYSTSTEVVAANQTNGTIVNGVGGTGYLTATTASTTSYVGSWTSGGFGIGQLPSNGTNELSIASAGTIPVAIRTTGQDVYVNLTTTAGTANTYATGLVSGSRPASGLTMRTSLAPVAQGTQHSQTGEAGRYMTFAQTVGSTKDVSLVIPIMTTTNCESSAHAVGRVTTTGSVGGAIGDMADFVQVTSVRNVAGTLTLVGTTTSLVSHTDTSQAGDTLTPSVSGTNLSWTVGALTTQGTVDWTITSDTVCN